MKQELVLLHGWGFQSDVWAHFLPYLENHFNVTALDLLGFGKNTNVNETLTLDLITKNVLENSPKSAIFIGWSLGGLVAMNIAIHYANRINQLITFASTPKFVADAHWPGMLPNVLEQFSDNLKIDYQTTLQQFVLLQFQGSNTDRRVIKSLKQQITNNPIPSERALIDGLTILKDTDLRNDLIKIECPQLFLFGGCDTLIPPAVAEKIIPLTKNSETDVLSEVGHAIFLSSPKICAEKIEMFLL